MGRLAGMTKRALATKLRGKDAELVADADDADLLVVADAALLDDAGEVASSVTHAAGGRVELVRESKLWEYLGLVESSLYTPAMLAELLRLPLATIRRWQRRGLITPVREVHRLPYFDFREVAWARRLVKLMAAGEKPAIIEKKLMRLAQLVPDVERHMAQLNVIVEGREILLRQGDGLVDADGQMRIDFDAFDSVGEPETLAMPSGSPETAEMNEPPRFELVEMLSQANSLEDEGDLEAAVDVYHAVLACHGPTAEVCFQLAE
ncbi:MAG: MerR family transcriptional regulator, partial [Pirellulaceae bacterium]